MNRPLVTVIIPTYNRVKLLPRAINSVLNQTYSNIEIIIVDDNKALSEEKMETKKLVDKYKKNISNIKYIDLEDNIGGALARNRGIENSNGEFICFLDDDDEIMPEKISLQVKKFLESDKELAVVGCFANIVDKNGLIIREEKNQLKGNVFKNQLSSNTCTTSLAMIRANILKQAGGFEKMPSSQEHMMFIKVFAINPYYDYVDKILVNIYHHDGERISTNKNKPIGAIMLHENVKEFYKDFSEEDKKEIDKKHYINIIYAFMSIKDKENAKKYYKYLLRKNKVFDKNIIKTFLVINIGLNNIENLRKRIKL